MATQTDKRAIVIDIPQGLEPAYRRIPLGDFEQEMLAPFATACLLQAICLDEDRLTPRSIAKLDELVFRFAEALNDEHRRALADIDSHQDTLWYSFNASGRFHQTSLADVMRLIESRMIDPGPSFNSPSAVLMLRPPNTVVTIERKAASS